MTAVPASALAWDVSCPESAPSPCRPEATLSVARIAFWLTMPRLAAAALAAANQKAAAAFAEIVAAADAAKAAYEAAVRATKEAEGALSAAQSSF